MRRPYRLCLAALVVVFASPVVAQDWCPASVDLIAAQHYFVGTVDVAHDSDYITVDYTLTEPGYCITETHLYVHEDRPGKSAPGQFGWGDDGLDCVTAWSEDIGWNDLGGGPAPVWIAAHAVVCGAGADYGEFELGINNEMASTPTGRVSTSLNRTGSTYWQMTFNDGDELAGNTYPGWCVDAQHTIGGTHQMELLPSYVADGYGGVELNGAINGYVDHPENLDLVNWVINQDWGSRTSECTGTTTAYTFGDIQRAIWQLVDDGNSTAGLGQWEQCRADEIEAAAWNFGEGFEPTCGHVVAVILVAESGVNQTIIFQVTFFELGLPCIPSGNCETAWGEGERIREKKNWAMTFEYAPCPVPEDLP